MKKTLIDELIDAYLNYKDSDCECSGPAYDYFKSQKEDLEKDLEVLDILKNKSEDIKALIYTIRNEKKLKDKYKYESILDFYNESVFVANDNKLTQEEFDKLVDWLKRNDIIRSENNGSN